MPMTVGVIHSGIRKLTATLWQAWRMLRAAHGGELSCFGYMCINDLSGDSSEEERDQGASDENADPGMPG